MARGALDNVEAEGDLARGMGIAIGMFIALFAIGIALFLIEQGKGQQAAQERAAARAATTVAPADSPAGAASTRTAQ